MSRIASSPTLKGLLAADRLRSQGMDVVDLGAGEPDFPTPDHVKAAARAAIGASRTGERGITNLRRRLQRNAPKTTASLHGGAVIVTAGGKQALYNTALSLFGPGDEVITHVPGWPTIVEQIKLADATPVVVRTSAADGFTLHAQPLIDAITPKTKGFIINSPANPTGALITEGELTKLAQAAKAKGLWIVLDLCYEQLIYEPVPANLPGVLFREMRERAIVCGSASKATR
jgi:aspartate aminotransferase